MAPIFVVFIIQLFFHPIHSGLLLGAPKQVLIEKLEQCRGEQTIMELRNVLLNYQQNTMTINAQINIKKQAGGRTDMLLLLTKCKDKTDQDTCEPYSRHNIPLECQQLHMKNRVWSDFVQHIQNLPDKCPLIPGQYNLINATVDLHNLEELPLDVGYWKIKAISKTKKESLFCVASEMEIELQRKRKG